MSADGTLVYHLQLRQFPHNHARFNLSEAELRGIAARWSRDEWIDEGDRKWSPHQATLTVLAGPRLEVSQLGMGRGWRNAQRTAQDVTQRVLATRGGGAEPSAHRAGAPSAHRAGAPSAGLEAQALAPLQPERATRVPARELSLLADSVGLELLALLDIAPASLADVYALGRARMPECDASECLALAELAVRSLLGRRLVELVRVPHDDARSGRGARARAYAPEDRDPNDAEPLGREELEIALRVLESWVANGTTAERVWVTRT